MFTGIIEALAPVQKFAAHQLVIARPENFETLAKGQSIAVNGACLSVIDFSATEMCFEVVPETCDRTNLKSAKMVNLERAMPADGRFEGHVVSGHVDSTTTLLRREKVVAGEYFTFSCPESIQPFMVQKGSITINGVSLTIANLSATEFSIALISHTLTKTNLRLLQNGDTVNLEADMMAKYLYSWFQQKNTSEKE